MPRKKKPTRKHSSQKRADMLTRRVVKDLGVVFVLNDTKYADVVNLKTKRKVELNSALDEVIRLIPHKWSLLLSVFCVDSFGEKYIKWDVGTADKMCLQRQLDESASKKHADLIRRCNENHLIGIGWIATPYECAFPEENDPVYESIFDSYGAWIPARDKLIEKVST